jgi:hypothetical protein
MRSCIRRPRWGSRLRGLVRARLPAVLRGSGLCGWSSVRPLRFSFGLGGVTALGYGFPALASRCLCVSGPHVVGAWSRLGLFPALARLGSPVLALARLVSFRAGPVWFRLCVGSAPVGFGWGAPRGIWFGLECGGISQGVSVISSIALQDALATVSYVTDVTLHFDPMLRTSALAGSFVARNV